MDHPSMKRAAGFTIDTNLAKRVRLEDGQDGLLSNGGMSPGRSSISSGQFSPGSPKQPAASQADVEEDFKSALEDLQMNNRYEISNLTLIAKENTEYAAAIARVLENHIKKTAPHRKLPALYVLDSIVKNVGTPYTLYFGQNLYRTFMEAYTLMDAATRKNMEAMLKTWKEPIPGSTDERPVFPLDTTKPIENALIRARTAFIQQQQLQDRAQRSPHLMNLSKPVTPIQQWGSAGQPQPVQHMSHGPAPDQRFSPLPGLQYLSAPPESQQQQQQQQQQHYQPPQDFQYNHNPPQDAYSQLQSPPPVYPQAASYQPPRSPVPQYSATGTGVPTSQPNSYSLVALLQAAGTFQPTPTPPINQLPPQQQYAYQPPPQQQQQLPTGFPPDALRGLEALFQKPATPSYANPAYAPPPQPVFTTPAMPVRTPPPRSAPPPAAPTTYGSAINDVPLTSASLKTPRPGLTATLFNTNPNQCLTCGRRFASDPQGKARKARHLDLHFRTNMRLSDASHTAVTRRWYADERAWIAYREVDDAEPDVDVEKSTLTGAGGAATSAGGKGAAAGSKERYVKAPADAAMRKYTCAICQEEFKAVWHDQAQEWVWMDAVAVGEGAARKVLHASCLEEMNKDRKGGGGTPVPVPGGVVKGIPGLKTGR